MMRTNLGKSRVRESRTLGSVGAKPNGLATRPSPSKPTQVQILSTPSCADSLARLLQRTMA
jgi:hypothetical protein